MNTLLNNKIRILTASALASLCVSASQAATYVSAIVDLGDAIGQVHDYLEYSTNATKSGISGLDGTRTPWTLNITGCRDIIASSNFSAANSWDGAESQSMLNAFAGNLGLSSLSEACWRDGWFLGSSSSGTVFSLTNLMPDTTYEISFGSGRRGNSSVPGVTMNKGTLVSGSWIRSDGTSGDSPLMTLPNTENGQLIATYFVTSDINGEIQWTIGAAQYKAVNFVSIKGEIVPIPEPAVASLGLMGLLSLAVRRKRSD